MCATAIQEHGCRGDNLVEIMQNYCQGLITCRRTRFATTFISSSEPRLLVRANSYRRKEAGYHKLLQCTTFDQSRPPRMDSTLNFPSYDEDTIVDLVTKIYRILLRLACVTVDQVRKR